MLNYTIHALTRMAYRGLSFEDVDYVLAYGKCHYAAGAKFYYLGKRQIPISDQKIDRFNRLEGTVVLLSSKDGNTVVTVYRNKKSFVPIRSKAKYNNKSIRIDD